MTDELLEKIEEIRRRFPVSYEKARQVLEETSGNLVEALILLEKRTKNGHSRELIEKLQKLWEEGNRSKIRVRKGNEVLVEVPVTAGVAGALLAPHLTLVGAVAALAAKYRIEVDKADRVDEVEKVARNSKHKDEEQPAGAD
ncbi:MAG: DUF4342 domain-containing protein [Clostridia bacterium]|nr:DUF4342 domain-containing protein [Clostridia bacterium]